MPEKKPAQEFELADSEVRERASLAAFFSKDADTDMSCLYHVHVVGTIANRQRRFVLAVSPDEFDKRSFLLGRGAIDNEAHGLHEGIDNFLPLFRSYLLFYCPNQNRNS